MPNVSGGDVSGGQHLQGSSGCILVLQGMASYVQCW